MVFAGDQLIHVFLSIPLNFSFLFFCLISIASGLGLGCSAPGIGLAFTAWFCLAPLLFIINFEISVLKAFVYGFLFGLAYNLLYLHWYLGLAPLDWLGFNSGQGLLLSWAALLIVASHQALLIGIFALVYRLLLSNQLIYTAQTGPNRSALLQMFLVPLFWTLIVDKLGNAHYLTGVPWSMLEYSQYKQIYFIQIADIIGGIGIGFLLVSVNTLIALVILRIHSSITDYVISQRSPSMPNMGKLIVSCVWLSPTVIFCFLLMYAIDYYGHYCLNNLAYQAPETISIVQPNINIEMYKTQEKYSLSQLVALEASMLQECPPGLCVWTEGALPTRLADDPALITYLKNVATNKQLSMILGTIDHDKEGNVYNAACGISASGQLTDQFYRKRYLVPFGEYAPALVKYLPGQELIRSLTNTPAGSGYSSGDQPIVLNLDQKQIAPLICFEVIAPELAAASVRNGGQLLVNINDLSWFHQSAIGEQMIACAVLRAVENRRFCIFAANTGPSAVISPLGEITAQIGQNTRSVLIGKIDYLSQLTLFSRWFMF